MPAGSPRFSYSWIDLMLWIIALALAIPVAFSIAMAVARAVANAGDR